MSNEPKDLKPESWHRYFAIENNNLAWSPAAKRSRTPAEAATMLMQLTLPPALEHGGERTQRNESQYVTRRSTCTYGLLSNPRSN